MFALPFQRLDAYRVFLIIRGGESLFFRLIFTVNMVYQVTTVGLNPLQLVLVGTMLELIVFVFEIPTGVVADVYSRRLSMIIGYVLIGIGFIIEGSTPTFAAVLLAQIWWGIGATFISGAGDAWISDEIGTQRAGRSFIRGTQIGQMTGIVGIIGSVALASVAITVPIITGGVLFVLLAVFLIVFMPEDGFTRTPRTERETWASLFDTFTGGVELVRMRPILITILTIELVYGAFTEGFDRLWTAHILTNFSFPMLGDLQPVVWFGVIGIISMLLSIGATELVQRKLDLTQHRHVAQILAVFYALIIISVVIFGMTGSFALALGMYWLAVVMRTTTEPIFAAWMNQFLESNVRATGMSIRSQINAIGQIGGGPGIGALGSRFSLRVALVTGALLLMPSLPLFVRSIGQGEEKS